MHSNFLKNSSVVDLGTAPVSTDLRGKTPLGLSERK